jgi:hypothetical protein
MVANSFFSDRERGGEKEREKERMIRMMVR